MRRDVALIAFGMTIGVLVGAASTVLLYGQEMERKARTLDEHWKSEITTLAARLSVLESAPKLLVSTAPLESLILPGGTLERGLDGKLRIAFPKEAFLPNNPSRLNTSVKPTYRPGASTIDGKGDRGILEGIP